MLEWNVYNEVNQQLSVYNVFKHAHFVKSLVDMFKDIKKEKNKWVMENTLDGILSLNAAKKLERSMEDFSDKRLNFECQYQFWGRCEYELILTDWPPSINRDEVYRLVDEDQNYFNKYRTYPYRFTANLCRMKKIDIYEQLKLNWEQFKKYVFDNEKEIKKLYKRDFERYFKK